MRVRQDTLVFSQRRFKGWVLDAFWKESSNALGFKPQCVYLYSRQVGNMALTRSRNLKQISGNCNLSIHHSNLSYLDNIGVLERIVQHNVLITHVDSEESYRKINSYFLSSQGMRLLVMNKRTESNLVNLGIPWHNIEVVYGAVDKKVFYPSKTMIQGEYILIAGDCKPRKNPAMIRELVLNNPDLKFKFESHIWAKEFSDIIQFNNNISFWDSCSSSRGDLYRNASVLCNLSFLEGGPIPVLQALASGTPILSSDVGFVSEVLTEGFGLVINLNLTIKEISVLLREVASTKRLVSTTDGLQGNFSWENLGRKLFSFAH
jgi:glycosyltransferase involved in cell wall biosynthesis